jgi:DNA-binding response OmpR family regulator
VILDLMLPDGKGEDLLPLLKGPDKAAIPVIVFSAREADAEAVSTIEKALLKSRASNEDLLETVRATIAAHAAEERPEL